MMVLSCWLESIRTKPPAASELAWQYGSVDWEGIHRANTGDVIHITAIAGIFPRGYYMNGVGLHQIGEDGIVVANKLVPAVTVHGDVT